MTGTTTTTADVDVWMFVSARLPAPCLTCQLPFHGVMLGCVQTAGPRGPIVMSDVHLIDKLAHFDRERIPERVVHAKVRSRSVCIDATHTRTVDMRVVLAVACILE